MRCPKCGSDNPAEYRFCGMCGTPLAKKQAPVQEPVSVSHEVGGVAERPLTQTEGVHREGPAPLSTLSGPSFLGLGTEPVRRNGRSDSDVSYLFDEEELRPRRTYWRFIFLLLFLAIVGGLAYLQYNKEGKSWTAPWSHETGQTPVQATQTDQQNEQPQQNVPAAPEQTANNSAGTPAGATNSNAEPQNQTAAANPAQGQPAQGNAQEAAPNATEPPNKSADTNKDQAESAKAEPPAEAGDNEPDTEKPASRVPATKPRPARPAAPPLSPDDALVANAERYLYGRGVPQNCDRALSALRSAAGHQNTRARTLLGTMYATGHCVPKDLPNAYRWFAQASRAAPDNMWVQRNLEMIWREMTPQERQLATRSQ